MNKVLGIINGTEYTIGDTLLELSYLVAALLFVVGLKMLSHPESARRGNLWAFAGMALAMATTLFLHRDGEGKGISIANIWIILAAIGVGAAIGWIIARKVKMTAMPQLVSLYNATGGAASALVALLEYPNAVAGDVGSILVTVLGLIIGAVAFSGSMIAYGKARW
jgi:H+-translocating NAD(P) transhydrogenase subunit beta